MDLLSLTNAYRSLANQGVYSPVWWNQAEAATAEPVAVFSPEAAWIIGDMLADRQARAYTFGLDSVLSTPFWTAVKTGTSKDMRDNWTIGWSADYTVGVWVGNSDGRSMQNVYGVSGAGPIWYDVMSYLHQHQRSSAPPKPSAVVTEKVHFVGVAEAEREEFFIDGTDMTEVVALSSLAPDALAPITIERPINGSILAIDPEIPASSQKLLLKASLAESDARAPALQWQLGELTLGQGSEYFWSLRRGSHIIRLKDAQGELLDEVRITVR